MLENLSPLLSRFSDVALGSQRQVNEMQMILNDLEYSLFGTCGPNKDEQTSEIPSSIEQGINMMQHVVNKNEEIIKHLYRIVDKLGISGDRMADLHDCIVNCVPSTNNKTNRQTTKLSDETCERRIGTPCCGTGNCCTAGNCCG